MPEAEVIGVVKNLKWPKNKGDPLRFNIFCPNANRTFETYCNFFCPVRENDTIYAKCELAGDSTLYIKKPPFVELYSDKYNIITAFNLGLSLKSFPKAGKLYDQISKAAGGDEKVIPFLCEVSQDWANGFDNDVLKEINKDDPNLSRRLLSWWHRERNLRRLYLLGFTKKEIEDCNMPCEVIYEKCRENPYSLAALSPERCIEILERFNKQPTPAQIYYGAVAHLVWTRLTKNGWVGTPLRILLKQFPDVLSHQEVLSKEYNLVFDMNLVYLTFPHKVETWMSNFIYNLRKDDRITYDMPLEQDINFPDGISIKRREAVYSKTLSDEQKKAVQGALDHKVCVITGGAGCGKTLTLSEILINLEKRAIPYAVCSFTGKAVARIREVTGKGNPCTIHRLIARAKKEDRPKIEHLVVDEASMVTTELLYQLLIRYPEVKQLTLVGDVNQLSPIGWGCLLRELILSETIPVYRLNTNYRVYRENGQRDGIILNANAVLSTGPGEYFTFTSTDNFSVIDGAQMAMKDGARPISEYVHAIVGGCQESGIQCNQLVVITPFNKEIPELNKRFQQIYDVGARFVNDIDGTKWMIGDRVMLTVNDPEIGVYNGETGIISDVSEQSVWVDFGELKKHEFPLLPKTKKEDNGRKITEEGDVIDDERTIKRLIHSYAITVDKSQGSEYDFVIYYIPYFVGGSFLNQNRNYTAMTRAKRCIWCVVPSTRDFEAVATKPAPHRYEALQFRLQDKLPKIPIYSAPDPNSYLTMENDIPDDVFSPEDYQ